MRKLDSAFLTDWYRQYSIYRWYFRLRLKMTRLCAGPKITVTNSSTMRCKKWEKIAVWLDEIIKFSGQRKQPEFCEKASASCWRHVFHITKKLDKQHRYALHTFHTITKIRRSQLLQQNLLECSLGDDAELFFAEIFMKRGSNSLSNDILIFTSSLFQALLKKKMGVGRLAAVSDCSPMRRAD